MTTTARVIDEFTVLLAIRSTVCDAVSMLAIGLEGSSSGVYRAHVAGDLRSQAASALSDPAKRYPTEGASRLEGAICLAIANAIDQHFAKEAAQ